LANSEPWGSQIWSDRLPSSPVRRRLNPIQLGVLSAARHQLFMRADLDEPRAVQDDDEVGHADGAEAVGDEDRDPSIL